MSEEPICAGDEEQRKRLSPIAIVIVMLVLYPLSIGPAAGLIVWLGPSSPTGQKVNDTLTTFYKPLVWIAEKSPSLIEWVTAYMGWFMR